MEIVVKATDVLSGYGEKKVKYSISLLSCSNTKERKHNNTALHLFYRLLAGFMALRQWE